MKLDWIRTNRYHWSCILSCIFWVSKPDTDHVGYVGIISIPCTCQKFNFEYSNLDTVWILNVQIEKRTIHIGFWSFRNGRILENIYPVFIPKQVRPMCSSAASSWQLAFHCRYSLRYLPNSLPSLEAKVQYLRW
jgi:hypothetical protein